jgi:DNA-binding NtrC family response regulator
MAAVWLILGKTRYPAELIESSRQHGVKTASVPFEISAELVPDLLRRPDAALQRHSAAPPPELPEFAAIVHRSEVMARLLARARLVAARSVPVLLEGETGTGKELLARAIHAASPRRARPFVPSTAAPSPSELVESTLFGHAKGSFTGAVAERKGVFEAAHGGTLFLDELGELPLAAQVKLLRTLQAGEVTRIGETAARKVDVRIIAATHRDLLGRGHCRPLPRGPVLPPRRRRPAPSAAARAQGRPRPAHRPPVRQGPGRPRRPTRLHAPAPDPVRPRAAPPPPLARQRARAVQHPPPRRALGRRDRDQRGRDPRGAVARHPRPPDAVLGRPLGDGFSLTALLDDVSRHYLTRALAETGQNKTRAAEILGLASYQTLTNWLARLEV